MKAMTDKDRAGHLTRLGERRQIIESGVAAVVQGYQPAMFIYGPPGLGKSHMLTTLLDGMAGKGWRHHTAYSTPRALMLSLTEDISAVHLFEDCETLLKTKLSADILRAACGSPGERERLVTYETAHEVLKVRFAGGIIIATNTNLQKTSGPLQGVASRFRPMRWDMTFEERAASILDMASRGWVKGTMRATPAQATKVAQALLDMVSDTRLTLEFDLRLYCEHALPAFAHAQARGKPEEWRDIMLAKLTGTVETVIEAREDKSRRLRTLALTIDNAGGKAGEKVRRWVEATGLGQAIYYRHLREAKEAERTLTKKA